MRSASAGGRDKIDEVGDGCGGGFFSPNRGGDQFQSGAFEPDEADAGVGEPNKIVGDYGGTDSGTDEAK